ncbi:KfrB domain-containing protein [Methylosarcina fibrata]|uniref:KfrB domain-containing protein n=1 Tax=Methylosarcina fibrata TaxID=105972 RepID=UPI001E38D619|nr:KfrB domain-containing protein [Methylosarcina fibrata]
MLTGFSGLEIGQRTLQNEQDGAWTNQKVDKAGALKPGIYNLYLAEQADKTKRYDGVIVHVDSNHIPANRKEIRSTFPE